MVSYRTIIPTLLMAGFVISGPSHAQAVCLTDSDPDGDGWGWENNQSCRVANSAGQPSQPASVTGASNATGQQCIDTDGDGYGWDGSQTCFIQTTTTPVTTDTAIGNEECIDADGDGYGWDGSRTCLIDSTPTQVAPDPTPTVRLTATNDTGTVISGRAVIDVLSNDFGNIDPTTVATAASPSKGRVQINNRTGVVTYIPYAGSTGRDTYRYTVRSTNNEISNVATVTIALDASIPCAVPSAKNQTVSVLLVGNSLMNDVQSRLKDLLDCGGYDTELATSNPGGSFLFQHDENQTTSNLIAQGYDLTLLQEQSNSINTNVAPYTVINSLKRKIEAAGSVMGFYQTWGYQHRDPVQTEDILSGYDRVADDFNAPLIHIGRAWDYFYTSHSDNPPFSLYLDYAHATDEGKALIAYVLYAYLTGESPVGLHSFLLSDANAQLLQSTAWTSYLANR